MMLGPTAKLISHIVTDVAYIFWAYHSNVRTNVNIVRLAIIVRNGRSAALAKHCASLNPESSRIVKP